MAIMYDPEAFNSFSGLFGLLTRWNGTLVPLVLGKASFWLFLMIHVYFMATEAAYKAGYTHTPWPEIQWSTVKTTTGLLTFFIVFYSGQCYTRFQLFYGHCVGIGGGCMSWAALVRTSLPMDPCLRWNVMRLVLASVHVLFYGLNSGGGPAVPVTDDEWEAMRKRHLLTIDEIKVLQAYAGYKPFLPIIWALEEVEDGLKQYANSPIEGGPSPPQLASAIAQFRNLALDIRGHCGQITNWLKQPVPFPYFHFLMLLMCVDLSLISYAIVAIYEGHWIMTFFIYVVILIAFLGLKEVAVAMADPFGDDEIDFDTEAMLGAAYNNAVACLRDDRKLDGAEQPGGIGNPIDGRPVEPVGNTRVVKIFKHPPPSGGGAPLL